VIAGPTGTFTYWDWPATTRGFTSLEWTVTPQTDPTPDGYFWSHQFWLLAGEAGSEAGYAGLQTVGSAPTGKIAIFSVWNSMAAAGPEFAAPFTGEGDGFSVRVRFPWEVGHAYPFRVAATGGDAMGGGATGGRAWPAWSAWVAGQLIGTIQVPESWLGLRDVSVMWTERYSGGLRTASDIRRASALFGRPTATDGRGRAVGPLGHRNVLAEPAGSPGSAITDVASGVVQVMGGDP
jgi:hypothetical protein